MKPGRWISLMLLLVALYLLWRVKQVLLLIFTAVVLAIPLNRLVRRWQRLGIKRGIAMILSVITLLTVLLLVIGIIVPPFVDQLQRLTTFVVIGLRQFQDWLLQLQLRLSTSFQLPSIPLSDLTEQTQPLASWIFDQFFSLFSDVLAILLRFLLILVLTVMLLANPAAYRGSLIQLVPSFYRRRIDAVVSQCEEKLVTWMRETLWQMLIVGIISAIGLWVLQIPLVLTNAALAGLLEVIPNLGVVLSLIPAVAAAWLIEPWKVLAVITLYVLIQFFKPQILKRLGQIPQETLLPAVMLLSQLCFAFFFGLWGLVLAVPFVLVVQVCTHEIFVKDVLPAWQKPGKRGVGRWGMKR